MSATLQRRTSGAVTSATPQTKTLNAETVTAIATGFLKRIGHKGGLKPKRVSLEEGDYTHEIKEYEIQPKGEEVPFISISPKVIMIMFGVSAIVYVALYFAFKMLGL